MRAVKIAVIIGTLAWSAPHEARAQEMAGRITDKASGAPVAAAFVRLVSESGTSVAQMLTDAKGYYKFNAPVPGNYLVRIERLGYETFQSDAYPLVSGIALTKNFEVPSSAISLPQITASSSSPCDKAKALMGDTRVLWDEIRKALALTSWTADNATIDFDLVDQMRWLNERLSASRVGKKEFTSGTKRGSPFAALASDSLLEKGFIQVTADKHHKYFAPDAELITSEPFQNTHCFQAKADAKHPGLIGLAFEPAGIIKPYDVRGTLWIDRASGLLTTLDFTYDKLPVDAPKASIGGEVHFTRFDTGMWIISGWALRIPIVAKVNTPNGTRDMLMNIQEKSQYVVKAKMNGVVVFSDDARK